MPEYDLSSYGIHASDRNVAPVHVMSAADKAKEASAKAQGFLGGARRRRSRRTRKTRKIRTRKPRRSVHRK
jgi:hypothetical protein